MCGVSMRVSASNTPFTLFQYGTHVFEAASVLLASMMVAREPLHLKNMYKSYDASLYKDAWEHAKNTFRQQAYVYNMRYVHRFVLYMCECEGERFRQTVSVIRWQ